MHELRELIREFSLLPVLYEREGAQGRLVQVLLDRLLAAPESGLILPWPSDPRLLQVCEQLQAQPAGDWSLQDLAEQHTSCCLQSPRLMSIRTMAGFWFSNWAAYPRR